MAELAALKKQKSTNKAKLTNIIKFANEAKPDTPLEQLSIRLSRVDALMQEFTELEHRILKIDINESVDMAYEENYYNAIAFLNTLIRERNLSSDNVGHGILNLDTSNNATQFGTRSEVKLPKIHIPTFSGDYSEWQSFYDLYTTTIHEAPSLNAVQKFQYLKGLLRGEAAILLRHINVTEGNYIGALNKLKERYDRKKYIINSFIRTFVEQSPIHSSNALQIKRLMDTSDEVIRGLKALGESAESRDPWLIYILMSKLDDKSNAAWAEATADMENPDFPQFLKFLARRIDTLESFSISSRRTITKSNVKAHVANIGDVVKEANFVNNNVQFQCAMCQDKTHTLLQCNKFQGLDATKRREFAQQTKRCFNCLSSRHPIFKCQSRRRCQTCGKKHHTLLHQREEENMQQQEKTSLLLSVNHSQRIDLASILPTAIIKVVDHSGKLQDCRALLDSGSQANFISKSCMQRLGLKTRNARISIRGIGQSSSQISKGLTSFAIKPEVSSEIQVDALVMTKITSKLPEKDLDRHGISLWRGIKLADPYFNKRSDIDILIGADHFFNLLLDGQIKSTPNKPTLQNTIFGWVVSGRTSHNPCDQPSSMASLCVQTDEKLDIDRSLRRFWELDSVDEGAILSSEEVFAEKHFLTNLQRNEEGRFMVRFPFKESPTNLGQSLPAAIQRLRSIERRFQRDPAFCKLYSEFLAEYELLNHMTELSPDEASVPGVYLPHHGVLKSSSSTTKLRVVFDSSSKSTTGISLNDNLAIGPTVQSALFAIILRFREHKYVISADIQKMYRQVLMSPEDRQYQRIVWRTDPSQPIRHFKLNTVTYGLASSSFLATRAIKQIAEDNKTSMQMATNAILKDMYVDDLMTGTNQEDQLISLKEEISSLLAKYGFQLRKWNSNCRCITDFANNKNQEVHIKELHDPSNDSAEASKVLGISWNTKIDSFTFTTNLSDTSIFTKRVVLSEASRIFDPLGWVSPVVIKTKIFLQMLWEEKLDWDDPLPSEKRTIWEKTRNDLKQITSISIPRFINTNQSSRIELHGFCDASQMAYAAVVYFKVIDPHGKVFVSMVASKTKVAPIKQQTLPRLELCGAVLLTRLIESIRRETQTIISDIYTWTDSQIVLDWLKSHPKRWSTFIGNRTAEILASVPQTHWRHVQSVENPADCATRGMSPKELEIHSLWWNGPKWLYETSESWPRQSVKQFNLEERAKTPIILTVTMESSTEWYEQLITKYSSFHKLQRILCYILRFIKNTTKLKGSRIGGLHLRREEMLESLYTMCRNEQIIYYHDELVSIRRNEEVKKGSPIMSLNPYLDTDGIIRVGGRLQHSIDPHSTKHPIILHSRSKLTFLILQDAHHDNKHAGPSLLLSIVRQEFWIPSGKTRAKEIVRKCITCSKFKAQCQTQIMGNLPRSRVEYVRPFLITGVDYAGPISINLSRGRGQKTYKAYICLFICLSTKAVHLELASDMSSDSFLGALKRFTARRGICQELHSDNGSNFVGADAKLRKEFAKIINHSNNISDFFSRHRIYWHFIPPNSPHFGGIWEAAIKSAKYHIKRVLGKNILTLEEMNTLLAEVEGILNSRPLCRVNEADIDPLTPSHFLLGHPTTKIPEIDITQLKMSHLTRWQLVQQISQHFWNRWYMEYLTSLQQRSKWRCKSHPVKIDDVVIIKENNLPVQQWLLGRIINVHPGSDGVIRVATIKTQNSEFKRPIHKLCVLPIPSEKPDDVNPDGNDNKP